MKLIIVIIFLLVLILLMTAIAKKSKNKNKVNTTTDKSITGFTRNLKFMTEAEKNFFRVLLQLKQNDAFIFVKVRMQDIIQAPYQKMGYVNSKHFDFVVTDLNFNVLNVIELDDNSHNSPKQAENDRKKDAICNCAGIKIIRVKAKRSYSIEEITSLFS